MNERTDASGRGQRYSLCCRLVQDDGARQETSAHRRHSYDTHRQQSRPTDSPWAIEEAGSNAVSGRRMNDVLSPAVYAIALGRLSGVGRRTAISVMARYPDPATLLAASEDELSRALGGRAATAIAPALVRDWPVAVGHANRIVADHQARSIAVVGYLALEYPPLLRLVPDPPVALYVRGDVTVLSAPMIAVVGTRTPTAWGAAVARRLARRLADEGVVISSGLAKGIDTAGHEGALDAETGLSVAVFGTAIDKVYPAENKALAARIAERGALVSEYAIGTVGRPDYFVDRDRLQAGLSMAVIPVQTGLRGGTQHTIRFAIEASRPLFVPPPSETEIDREENAGIVELLRNGSAQAIVSDDLGGLVGRLREQRDGWLKGATEADRRPAAPVAKGRKRAKKAPSPDQTEWLLPEEGSATDSPSPTQVDQGAPPIHTIDEVIAELDSVLDRVGPRYDLTAFDAIVRAWRQRRHS
jgi:DNA processing protein